MAKWSRLPRVLRNEGVEGVRRRASYHIWKHFGFLYKLLNKKYVRSAYGPKFRANYGDATFDFYCKGAYGRFYSTAIESIGEEFYFLDIGANQGLYTILAALNPKCRQAVAFEPVKTTARFCAENIRINDVQDKARIVEKAISDTEGQTEISVDPQHSGATSLTGPTRSERTGVQTIELANHRVLDDLAFEDALPIYVKVDVEGHEETVIRELFRSSIAGRIVQIYYECNERWVSADAIERFLAQKCFELEKVGTGTHYDVLASRKPEPR